MSRVNLPALAGTNASEDSAREPSNHRTDPNVRLTSKTPSALAVFRSKTGLEIEVIELSDNQFEALVSMYQVFEPKRGAQGLPPIGRERIVAWLRDLQVHGHNLLVLSEGRVIGHSMLCPVDAERAEFAIFLDQKFRNQGIGTKLTEATLDYARRLNFRDVWLSVETNNQCAIRVYRKTGFLVSGLFGPEQEMALALTRNKAEGEMSNESKNPPDAAAAKDTGAE